MARSRGLNPVSLRAGSPCGGAGPSPGFVPPGPRGLAAPGQRLRPRLCRGIGEPSHRDPAGRQNRREPAPAAPSGPPGRGRRRRRRAEEKPFLPCGAGEPSRIDPIDPLSPPRKPRGWSPAPRVCSPRLHRSGGTGQRAGEGPPGRRGRGAGSRGRRGPPGPSWPLLGPPAPALSPQRPPTRKRPRGLGVCCGRRAAPAER